MSKISKARIQKIFFLIAVICVALVFVASANAFDAAVFANPETEFTDGEVSTVKLEGNWLEEGVASGATLKLNGSKEETSEGGEPISISKDLTTKTNILFSDPQIIKAIAVKRLKVDIEISGSNKFEVLENGTWTENFNSNSILEKSIVSKIDLLAYNRTANIADLKGSFTNHVLFKDLELNSSLMNENKLALKVSSSISILKEPSASGANASGVRISTNITEIKIKFHFKKLKVDIVYEGGQGKVSYLGDAYSKPPNTDSRQFEIGFIKAEYSVSNPTLIVNRPTFTGLEELFEEGSKYFFIGWIDTTSGSKTHNVNFETKFLEEVSSTVESVRYRAVFRLLTYHNDEANIAYVGSSGIAVAPELDLKDGDKTDFLLNQVNRYIGIDGTVYDSELKPINVGRYRYSVEVSMGNAGEGGVYPPEQIALKVNKDFSIVKARPNIEFIKEGVALGSGPNDYVDLNFGAPLSHLKLDFKASHRSVELSGGQFAYIKTQNISSDVLDKEKVFIRDGSNIYTSTLGLKAQYVKFIPADTANYEIVSASFNLLVKDTENKFTIRNQADNRTANFVFSVVSTVDTSVPNNLPTNASLTNPVLKLTFNIDFTDTSGASFFLGIAKLESGASSLDYISPGGPSMAKFDYYFRDVKTGSEADVEKEIKSKFFVDYIKDVTAGLSAVNPNILEYKYQGKNDQASIIPDLALESDQRSFVDIPLAEKKYYEYKTTEVTYVPYKIGAHSMKYKIYLVKGGNRINIGERELEINVVNATLTASRKSVANDGYNSSTGWARDENVQVLATGVKALSIIDYYYSNDNKATFTKINESISATEGCAVTFTPTIPSNDSFEKSYYIIAVNSSDGKLTTYNGISYSVVGETKVNYTSKLDTKVPTITSVTSQYSWGTWTSGDVTINIEANHGLSGIRFSYRLGENGSFVSSNNTSWEGLGMSGNHLYSMVISGQANNVLDSDIYIKVESGTGNSVIGSTPLSIKIDKSNPTLSLQSGISDRWYQNDVEIVLNCNELGSGISLSNITIDTTEYFTNLAITNTSPYRISFKTKDAKANMKYTVVVKDAAGNSSNSQLVKVSVDKTSVSLDINNGISAYYIDENGNNVPYIAGEWTNKPVKMSFTAYSGSSKIRILEKKQGDADFVQRVAFSGYVDGINDNIKLSTEFDISHSSDGVNNGYIYKLENEAGHYLVHDFGLIKVDLKAPTITAPIGFSDWRNTEQALELNVAEIEADILKSKIKSVRYKFGDGSFIDSSLISGSRYSFNIQSPLEVTIEAEDNAGNKATTVIARNTYKVDTIDFVQTDLGYEAFVGGGNINDPYDQETLPSTVYGFAQNDWSKENLRIEFKLKKIPASGIIFYQVKAGSSDLSLMEYYPNNTGMIGAVSTTSGFFKISAYLQTERRDQIGIKAVTGTGASFTLRNQSNTYINIDKTDPLVQEKSKLVDGVSIDFLGSNNWVNKNGIFNFDIVDGLSGIQTKKLEKKVVGASDNTYVDCTAELVLVAGNNYSITFTNHMTYRLFIEDKAGRSTYKIYTPKIDKFANFEIVSCVASIVNKSDDSTSPYVDRWLENNEKMRIVLTSQFINSATQFGPSEAYVDFKTVNSNTYMKSLKIGDVEQGFTISGQTTFTMELDADQISHLTLFRLRTGGGESREIALDVKVRKDTSAININFSANIIGVNEVYNSQWTQSSVNLKIRVKSGPSASKIYYATADEYSDVSAASWIFLANILERDQVFEKRFEETINKKVFIKIETLKNTSTEHQTGYLITIDKGDINPRVVGKKEDDTVYDNYWTDNTIMLSFARDGMAPIVSVRVKDGALDYVTVPGALSGTYQLLKPGPTIIISKTVKVEFKNAANKVEVVDYIVKQSLVEPSYNYTISAENNTALSDGWYTSRVQLRFVVDTPSDPAYYSAYKYYIRKKAPTEAEYGEWNLITPINNIYYISDNNANTVKGGSDYEYSIRVVAPNGRDKVYEGQNNLKLKIDQATYVAKIVQKVGDLSFTNECAFFANHTFSAKRGQILSRLTIIPKNGFFYRSIDYSDGTNTSSDTFTKAERANNKIVLGQTGTDEFFKIVGSDVSVNISYYRLLEIKIANQTRFVQDNSNTEMLNIVAEDPEFVSVFGPLIRLNEEFSGKHLKIKLKFFASDTITVLSECPTELGEYYVELTDGTNIENSPFILDTSKRRIKVSYFKGLGTYSSPYLIHNANDFINIDRYMKYEPSYETLDPYSYLNNENGATIRYSAYFRQTQNIVFEIGQFPVKASDASYVFKGVYDGDGFELQYPGSIRVENNTPQGFFPELENAKLRNVRVNYSAVISTESETEPLENVQFGLLASKIKNSLILYSYAIGNITIQKVKNYSVGGIVGYAEDSLIANSLADVIIKNNLGNGSIGGIIGKSKQSYMIRTYFVGDLVADNIIQAQAQNIGNANLTYIGTLIGHQTYNLQAGQSGIIKIDNYVIKYSLNINGSIVVGLSTGNNFELITATQLTFKEEAIRAFLTDETTIIRASSADRERAVSTLVLYRIELDRDELNISGIGTEASPIIIDSAAKLKVVDRIPWAYYTQSVDIELDLSALETSDYPSIISSAAFVGGYNGQGHKIVLKGKMHSKSTYLGLFNILGGSVKDLIVKGINIVATCKEQVYVGGITGLLLEGAKIENVYVSGQVEAIGSSEAYIGGLAGEIRNSQVNGTFVDVKVITRNTHISVAGALAARVSGESVLRQIAVVSALDINVSNINKAALYIGEAASAGIVNSEIYIISNGLYVNKLKLREGPSNYFSESNIPEAELVGKISDQTYKNAIEYVVPVVLGKYSSTFKQHLKRVSEFSLAGEGTQANPYKIANYQDLLLIEKYMSAHYILVSDIVIGDYDGDGIVDEEYKYDFDTIGSKMPFTGVLDGQQKKISNLTKSLFAINAGDILNLQLDYRIVYRKRLNSSSPIHTQIYGGDSLTLGLVANENWKNGLIIGIYVSGVVDIVLPSCSIVFGGISGINYGLEIKANNVVLERASVTGLQVSFGGIIGESKENRYIFLLNSQNHFIPSSPVYVSGLDVNVGVILGYLHASPTDLPDAGPASTAKIYANGELIDPEKQRIGNLLSS